MLCRADSIGVFQVESRAQMGLLPRLQPRKFYDLVVQIALVRPGPIQGGAVHPFVRRKLGQEEVTYAHPKLVPPLERTLGIPVFQEQLMQMAMAVGECSGEDADLLRRAMGSKRGLERIDSLKEKLYAGMASNGLVGRGCRRDLRQDPGVRELRVRRVALAVSFALLVYASSWIKLHYPAAFLAGLLRAQPMGFYSPASLTADARRHGVEVRRPDILLSAAEATLERVEPRSVREPTGLDSCTHRLQPPVGDFDRQAPDVSAAHRRDGNFAVRLGLAGVTRIGAKVAERIVAEREAEGAFRSMEDLVRRTGSPARSSSRSPPPAPSTPSTSGAARRSGARARPPRTGRSSSPTRWSPCSRRCSPIRPRSRRSPPTCGRPGSRPTITRSRTSAPTLDPRGVLPSAALKTAESGRRGSRSPGW